ncbi:MAG: hypothetical protein IJI35_01615 [Kiritimatiellae bacterium]|nr:hypothetical protein [Kiritimatiellia bacterium]
MKNVTLAFCLALPLVSIAAGPSAEETALYKARRYGAEARECLRVIDQDSVPVAGARVWGGLQTGDGYKDFIPIRGNTNTNGEYVVQGKCTNRITCEITKDGYYDSVLELVNYGYRHSLRGGKWQPYGNTTEVVMKKIVNPVAVGIRYVDQKIPTFGQWVGYDFELADWISPFGKGKQSDVMIRFASREVGPFDFGYKMELSFTHYPFAGVIRRKNDTFSRFPCAYAATTNDVYKSVIVFEVDRAGTKKRIWNQLENNEYLIFRTRTRVNEKGELTSAHYGRIDGEWKFYELHGMWIRGVYFNNIANDTNLEDKFSFEDAMQRKRRREESAPVKSCKR